MDVFKRYAVSLGVAAIVLFVIVYFVERYFEGMMPHNLAEQESDQIAITLPAGKSHEKCLGMQKRQQLVYGFQSSTPLVFNLHFHHEGKIHYPFESQLLDKHRDTFHPEEDSGYYCMMWGNSEDGAVDLEYRYRVSASATK